MEALVFIVVFSLPLDAALLLLWCGPLWKERAGPPLAAVWSVQATISGKT
jgi:hypothetical protein